MGAMRNWGRRLVLCAAVLLLAASAQATPLGLLPGDIVTQMEWDALQTVSGDGGVHDPALGTLGGAYMDGQLTSVSVNPGPITRLVSDTTFRLDMDFVTFTPTDLGGGLVFLVSRYSGAALVDPDLTVTDLTGTILELDFAEPFIISGVIDTNAAPNEIGSLNAQVRLSVEGGDPLLIAALGGLGTGGGAQLQLTGTLFGFDPSLSTTMAGDQNPFNDFFTFSGTGLITVENPAPFVPEPSAGLLLGAGLLGLATRRRR